MSGRPPPLPPRERVAATPPPLPERAPPLPPRGTGKRTEVTGVEFLDGTTRTIVLENFLQLDPNNSTRVLGLRRPRGISPQGLSKLERASTKAYPPTRESALARLGGKEELCKKIPAAKFARASTIPENDINRVRYTDAAFDLVVRKIPSGSASCTSYKPVIAQRFTTYDATAAQLASMQKASEGTVYDINPQFSVYRNQDTEFATYRNAKRVEQGELIRYEMTSDQKIPLSTAQDRGYVFTLSVRPMLGSTNQLVPPFDAEARVFPLPKVSDTYTLVLTNEAAYASRADVTPEQLPSRIVRAAVKLVVDTMRAGTDSMVIESIEMYFPYSSKRIVLEGASTTTTKKTKKRR